MSKEKQTIAIMMYDIERALDDPDNVTKGCVNITYETRQKIENILLKGLTDLINQYHETHKQMEES